MTGPGILSAADTRRLFGLDVVGAIAILLVIQAHIGQYGERLYGWTFPRFLGLLGSFGVELFFVLSGFLIGGLLLEVAERSPTLQGGVRFLLRRWMRTLPLYILWTLVIFVLYSQAQRGFPLVAHLTFTQNFHSPMPYNSYFPVSWSLTVEEWFYLLFSAILLVSTAIWPRRAMLLTCALFIVTPLALRVCSNVTDVDEGLRKVAIFRLDAIAYGAIMAWMFRAFPEKMRRLCVVLALAGLTITLVIVLLSNAIAPAFIFTLYPLGLALILPAMSRLTPPWQPAETIIKWVSTRSYGLYLIHLTIIDIAVYAMRTGRVSTFWFAGVIASVFVLADLLHRYFERPIMALRPEQFPQKRDATIVLTVPVSKPG